MALIGKFGTAPDFKQQGYRGIGIITGKEEDVLKQFFADNVVLVKGAEINFSGEHEFFVMVANFESK